MTIKRATGQEIYFSKLWLDLIGKVGTLSVFKSTMVMMRDYDY